MDINNETADRLVSLIRKIVREEITNTQRNSGTDIETFRHCLVTSEDNGLDTWDLKELSTGEKITSVPNKSGEAIDKGDTVRIYETSGSYNNCYIGLRCS